jgi:hypothetical protein
MIALFQQHIQSVAAILENWLWILTVPHLGRMGGVITQTDRAQQKSNPVK